MLAERKKVKVERETGRKEMGNTKENVDPKERGGPRESGQVQVTRGTILGIIPIGTARRMVLRWIRGRLYSQFETELREFSELKHVRKGHCTNTLQLENSGTFAHVKHIFNSCV